MGYACIIRRFLVDTIPSCARRDIPLPAYAIKTNTCRVPESQPPLRYSLIISPDCDLSEVHVAHTLPALPTRLFGNFIKTLVWRVNNFLATDGGHFIGFWRITCLPTHWFPVTLGSRRFKDAPQVTLFGLQMASYDSAARSAPRRPAKE